MDISNNYINQNEQLRNALLDLLFGRTVQLPNIPIDSSNNMMNDPLVGPTTSDITMEARSIDNDYINFFRNYFFSNRLRRQNNSLESILQQSFIDPSQNIYKNVLSDKGESDIKSVVYKKGEFPNDNCPVTLIDFEEGHEVSQLPCGHIFEKEAVLKWLKDENASCPVCRKPLASKEVKRQHKNVVLQNNVNQGVNTRVNRRDFIQNYIQTQIQREEEAELQAAIIASLREQNTN